MSAFPSVALDAISFQLAAALERYEQDLDAMVDTWLEPDLYRKVSQDIDEIRRYCAALPQLSVPWVELLISHAELVHSLWRLRSRERAADRAELQEARVRHAGCLASLKSRCMRMLVRTDARRRA